MKLICPNCGEIEQYKIKENACREAIYAKNGDLMKRTKYECFNLGKPRCLKCNSALKVRVKLSSKEMEFSART